MLMGGWKLWKGWIMSDKTDKELLELAAKAVGIECDEVGPYVEFKEWQSEFGMDIGGSFELVRRNWEPLDNDVDALRLAVNLSMHVDIRTDLAAVVVWPDTVEQINGDPYAATRRAIVRAAAAIGERL
jgi:hypothetical protein